MPKNLKPSPFLLDCTLRDGSYAINFKFTAKDTKNISSGLDNLGFDYIEIGHGMGLGASREIKYRAAASDQEYMKAASLSVKKNKWGVFCIPGIAKLDDLRLASDYGAKFIRIGSDIKDNKESESFISLGKSLGLEVFANLMKSYTISPKNFALLAEKSINYGADIIYIVDSSGSMLPNELIDYIFLTQEKIGKKKIGFHGHNNLGMAIANSLTCCEENIFLIDTTIQGIGRSSGNAPSEQLVSSFIRGNFRTKIDPIELMNFGEKYIRPFISQRGIDTLDTIAGLSKFHSSYMSKIIEVAKEFHIDPKELITSLCKKTISSAPDNLIRKISTTLQKKCNKKYNFKLSQSKYYGNEQK